MTSALPGSALPALPDTVSPVVRISRAALRTNLTAVLSTTRDAVIDVRADGWGHGLDFVARTAVDCGAGALLVDDGAAFAPDALPSTVTLLTEAEAASSDAVYGTSAGFAAVMSLHGRVLGVKSLRQGEGVSYGYSFRAPRDTVVALVTGGYAQGVVRALGNSARVRISGQPHPIVGRVAMDVCVVDVGADSSVHRGEDVVFFGRGDATGAATLAEWSDASGLTAAELVTAVGLRNEREYVA